jgi:hypothetical protein
MKYLLIGFLIGVAAMLIYAQHTEIVRLRAEIQKKDARIEHFQDHWLPGDSEKQLGKKDWKERRGN